MTNIDKWTNPHGGNWNDLSDWSDGDPSQADDVILPQFGTSTTPYTVVFDTGVEEQPRFLSIASVATLDIYDEFGGETGLLNYGTVKVFGSLTSTVDAEFGGGNVERVTNYGTLDYVGKDLSDNGGLYIGSAAAVINHGEMETSGAGGFFDISSCDDVVNAGSMIASLLRRPAKRDRESSISTMTSSTTGAARSAQRRGATTASVWLGSVTLTGGTLEGHVIIAANGNPALLVGVVISGAKGTEIENPGGGIFEAGGLELEGTTTNEGLVIADRPERERLRDSDQRKSDADRRRDSRTRLRLARGPRHQTNSPVTTRSRISSISTTVLKVRD